MNIEILFICLGFVLVAAASKQIGHLLRHTGLPLISGFLFTGMIAGPYVLEMIPAHAVASLRFVDEIALGFIAFAAGSELYFREIRLQLKKIASMTACLVVFTFSLVTLVMYFLSASLPVLQDMGVGGRFCVSILAGAIMVARSPSSAIAIVSELRAKGPFTQTVLGVTVIMDVVVIILFSINSSIADAVFAGLPLNLWFLILLIFEIAVSCLSGYLAAKMLLLLMVSPLPSWIKTVFTLCSGYLVFVTCSWLRHASAESPGVEIYLEPLLICMVAGFLVANTTRFRREFARVLQDAAGPVYIVFFTLTGASLSLDVLLATWPVAAGLFCVRTLAIFTGTACAGLIEKQGQRQRLVSWMAFITQAGVGLGLAKEIVVEFPEWGTPFATIIIATIVLNQLAGPPLFKLAIRLMKEDHSRAGSQEMEENRRAVIFGVDGQASALAVSLLSHGWQVCLSVKDGQRPGTRLPDVEVRTYDRIDLPALETLGCKDCSAIVALLSDENNYKVCEAAYEHFGTPTLVARLDDRKNISPFQDLGVLIVDPSTAIVGLLDHFVRAPGAASLLLGLHENRKVEDLIIQNPDLAGLALRDLKLPLDTIIMSVKRRGVLFIPHDYTRFEPGDIVTVLGAPESLEAVGLKFDTGRKRELDHLVRKAAPEELGPLPVRDNPLSSGSDRLDELLAHARILDIETGMEMPQFFKTVSENMAPDLGIAPETLERLLREREQEAGTVLAPGLAIPHIVVDGTGIFSILVARCRKGISFSESQPRVTAAFVLVGSRDERNFHLAVLSAIAQMVLDLKFEKKWMRARSASGLRRVLLSAKRNRMGR